MNKNKTILTFLWLSALLNVVANFAHPVTPSLIIQLNLPSYTFGVAFASMAFTNFLFSPFWGKLIDSIGERNLMFIQCTGYAVGQFWFMMAVSEYDIMFGRMIAGFFMGGATVGSLTYVVRHSSFEDRGKNLTFYTTNSIVASTVGYFIGGFIGDISIQAAFLVQCVSLVVVGILFTLLLEKHNEKKSVKMKQLFVEANPFRSFVEIRKYLTYFLILLFFVTFVSSLASTTYDQSFNYYIKDIFNFKPSYNGVIKASVGLTTLIINFTLCLRIQRKKDFSFTLTLIFLVCSVALFWITHANNIILFLGINLFYFAAYSITWPLIQNLVSNCSETGNNGIILGFYNAMKSLGMIAGGLIAGFVYAKNPISPFLYASLGLLVSALIMFIYSKRKGHSKI